MEKETKWIRFRIPVELHLLFKRAASQDVHSRSLAHFAQLAMQDRAHYILSLKPCDIQDIDIDEQPNQDKGNMT